MNWLHWAYFHYQFNAMLCNFLGFDTNAAFPTIVTWPRQAVVQQQAAHLIHRVAARRDEPSCEGIAFVLLLHQLVQLLLQHSQVRCDWARVACHGPLLTVFVLDVFDVLAGDRRRAYSPTANCYKLAGLGTSASIAGVS